MIKKFIVRLSEEERDLLREIAKKLKGGSQKFRRANILLMADADGPNWKDSQIAEAYGCSPQTVENVRRRFVLSGFEEALSGVIRQDPPTPKKLDGRQEAEVTYFRTGPKSIFFLEGPSSSSIASTVVGRTRDSR